jgi:hypothetical protein
MPDYRGIPSEVLWMNWFEEVVLRAIPSEVLLVTVKRYCDPDCWKY